MGSVVKALNRALQEQGTLSPTPLPSPLQFMTEGEATKAENGELIAPVFKIRFDLSFVRFSGSLIPHVSQQENENNAHFLPSV